MTIEEIKKDPETLIAKVDELMKTPKTFQDWRAVYRAAPRGSDDEKRAIAQMMKTAQTYEDWREVYLLAPRGSDEEKHAITQMKELESSK